MERPADQPCTSAVARRRAALAAAYLEVTTCERIHLTPTVTIPLVLVDALDGELVAASEG
jgi:hypothetical protein